MVLNIILEDKSKQSHGEMYTYLGVPIHESLKGNKDYVDSNIVLNTDGFYRVKDNNTECTLYIDANKCEDKECVREKIKNAVDIFIDGL